MTEGRSNVANEEKGGKEIKEMDKGRKMEFRERQKKWVGKNY